MDEFTVEYLKHAMFDSGEYELKQSDKYNDVTLEWGDPENLSKSSVYEKNEGWIWNDGENKSESIEGISWGGCLESIDELLRHNIQIPTLEDFKDIVLFTETSEEMPKSGSCFSGCTELSVREGSLQM
jgi:muramoyltetrapeptide carboxypeptidase LdcA involved in peptidoglycan recycling